jgi:inhibitor of KinA
MDQSNLTYRIFPLGDSVITIDFGNNINESLNDEVITRFNELQISPVPGMIEAVPAYSSLTIYYDAVKLRNKVSSGQTVYEWMQQMLTERLQIPPNESEKNNRLFKIPVCYNLNFAPDIKTLADSKNLSVEEVIQLHTSGTYKVYMLGFLPGFAYMGEVNEKMIIPRKPQPVNVEQGSVGIAGKQTGIYPLASPGGWQIVGRTPLKLFDAAKEEPTLFKIGDKIHFFPITENDFYEIQNSFLLQDQYWNAE